MRLAVFVFLTIAFAWSAATAAKAQEAQPKVLDELDAKINRQLAQEKWSDASRQLVKTLWQEYRDAFTKNEPNLDYHGRGDAVPDVKACDEYVGEYLAAERPSGGTFLEVATDEKGRLLVKLEGHTIPAVAWNKGVLFTTGDVVYSSTPNLGSSPHATLEYLTIVRIKGEFSFCAPGFGPDQARKLVKKEKS
jgi:hypothetical protein